MSTPSKTRRSAGKTLAVQHISELTPDPRNARKHTPRNVGTIVDALHEVGAARSIVIDEDGVILAGNATVEAAGEAGITKVRVVDADGSTIVAVRRTGLTAAQKAKLALYDNRAADLATWDADVLRGLATELDLSQMFSAEELAAIVGTEAKTGNTDPDAVPEERATDIKPGDLFALGEHRLLCGDSTKAEDVARVTAGEAPTFSLTDPPYGVNYAERNMDRDGNAAVTLSYHEGSGFDPLDALRFAPPVVVMTYPIDRHFFGLASVLSECGYEFNRELVWVKSWPVIVLGSYYNQQHEPILLLAKKGHAINANSRMKLSTVFTTEKETAHADHPTTKPMELWAALLENHSAPGELVYEPFSGSGTTLIACEQLARRCRAIEIEPKYCQVAIDRWEAFTGRRAEKLA